MPACPAFRARLSTLAHTPLAAHVHTPDTTLTQTAHIHTLVRGHVSACPEGTPAILRTGNIMSL
eukprot:1817130-Prymnesium_polylepis.2